MKYISLIITLCLTMQLTAQEKLLESKVYEWIDIPAKIHDFHTKSLIVKGETSDLKCLEVYAISLFPGKKSTINTPSDTIETILFVKDGDMDIKLGETQKTLSQGSVVYILPDEKYSIKNMGKVPAYCLLMQMNSRKPTNLKRGKNAGGSLIIDFKEQEFKPHDKGGIRNYFRDRSTAMFGFTEMHVTTLNPQIKSHEPHTHQAAEMVIMLLGNTEMQIGENVYQAKSGDFYFLDSNVSHAIRNTGETPCMYVAFQWE